MKSTGIAPVFTASCAVQTRAGHYVTFDDRCVDTNAAHLGSFNGSTGLLTVQIPGVYLVLFDAMGSHNCTVMLRVNLVDKASSGFKANGLAAKANGLFSGSMTISALLPLKKGDQLGAFIASGELDQDSKATRFSAILFPL